ncbi:MAG: hypothetical protein ACJAYC_003518 [Halieaceae bacterium]|jgi:hypothetical protein
MLLCGSESEKPEAKNKNPGKAGVFEDEGGQSELLDLTFLVHHVLTYNWIILLHLKLIRGSTLILVSGVKMPCTR